MATANLLVHLSTKGQVVIPLSLRRRLGLRAGQKLSVRTSPRGEIVLTPTELDDEALADMLARAGRWAAAQGRDFVAELHARRAKERKREARERATRRR